MTKPGSECPKTLRLYESGEIRACGRLESCGGNCSSVKIPSFGIKYTKVCGRVIGHQFSRPNAFHVPDYFINDIDDAYVDGVSITYGTPRQHIWTLANSQYDTFTRDKNALCPCRRKTKQKMPEFVGDDYYCESGCSVKEASGCSTGALHIGDRLWDGKDCGRAEEKCCTSKQPWFYKVLDCATTEDIELRICGNEGTDFEDVPVELYEIFVK